VPGTRLGDGWHAFGGGLPDDGVVVIPQADAAAFLRHRSAARRVEILGWADAPDASETHPKPD
jgi:hypothetical protein